MNPEETPAKPLEPEQTTDFYLHEARSKIAQRMVRRVEYRGQLVEEIIRLQEQLRVAEGLLVGVSTELAAMQTALDVIPVKAE